MRALPPLLLMAPLALAATAAAPPVGGNCLLPSLAACGVVVANACAAQVVTGTGVATSAATRWDFYAYSSYTGQLYHKSGQGLAFQDQPVLGTAGGSGYTAGALYADGAYVAGVAMGCPSNFPG